MMIKLVTTLALAYAALAAAVFAFQPRLVFLPQVPGRALEGSPADLALPYETVEIPTADGQTLHAWWVGHPAPRGTLLFSHGNAGNISHRLESLRVFHELGLEVLMYDYRGYGQSTGRPHEAGLYRDVDAAWHWLVEQRARRPGRIVLFGRSLGAAITARQAARVEPGCVILESAFTSVPDLGSELYWWLPVRWLSRIRLNTRAHLSSITAPVLLVHSRDDEIVPYRHAQRLLSAARDGTELLTISGDHNTGFLESLESYRDGLDRFLTRCLGPAE